MKKNIFFRYFFLMCKKLKLIGQLEPLQLSKFILFRLAAQTPMNQMHSMKMSHCPTIASA